MATRQAVNNTRATTPVSVPEITRIQVEGNDTVSFLYGAAPPYQWVRGMSQIMDQNPAYISYRYDTITISQVAGESFTFTIYSITDVGGNTFTALTSQDPSDVVLAKTQEIYRLLVTAIFKGCCECGNTEPECSIQYTSGNGEDAGTLLIGEGSIQINYFTSNNQDFTGFWPIIQDGSWIFIFSKTDPTVYGVFQLSNYSDGGAYALFDITLLAGTDIFPEGTSLCVDVTSVGGSLVQDWQDTLNISSLLTQDNLIDGGGFNFEWGNVDRYILNSFNYQSYIADDGAGSVGQVYIEPGAVTISGTNFIDVITPGYATATPGMVLALDASGHVEYTLAGTGTISSIGLYMPPAFTVSTPNPLTSNGDFTVTGAGTALEYIDGTGNLQTLPVYTVENGLHAYGGVPGESPADPYLFHLGGVLLEDTLITATEVLPGPTYNEWVLGVAGLVGQDTRQPFAVSNLGNGGVASFQDYGSGSRPNPSVEIVGDVDLIQPLLELNMEGDLPDANNTLLRLRYSGTPGLANTTIDYQFRNNNAVAANSNFIGSRLSTEVVNFVDNNEETRFNLQLIEGGTLANKLQVQGYGQLVLNEYGPSVFSDGVSNIDNDLEYVLAVDASGNVYKKLSEGGGTVTEVDATGLLTTSPNPITTTGTVTSEMNSGFLVGRYDAGVGVFQEITVGAGLDLSAAGVLTADGSVPVYTVDNGLSPDPLDSFNFQLGGPTLGTGNLVRNTYITNDGWLLRIDQSTGIGLEIYSEDDYASKHSRSGTTVNNFESLGAIRIDRTTSGVPFSGIGASIDFWIQPRETIVNPPPTDPTVRLSGAWLDPGPTFLSRRSTFDIYGYYNGGPLMNSSLSGIGQWQWYQYGQTPANFPDASPVWALGVDASGNVVEFEPGGSGTTYNGDQGVYKDTSLTPETFMLGAPSGSQAGIAFSIDRYIDTSTKFLSLSGTGSFVLKADTNAFLGVAVYGNADFGYGVRGSSNDTNSFGVWGGSKNGVGVYGESTNGYALFTSTTSPVNTLIRTTLDQTSLLDVVKIERLSSGPIKSGGGSSIATTLGTVLGSRISTYVSNGITGEISLAFQTRKDTVTPESTNMVLIGDGQLQLNKYGQTPANFPDAAPVWALGVDANGNVVEFEPAAGNTYTVNNGLEPQTTPTSDPNNFQLGGPLVRDTTIVNSDKNLTITGDSVLGNDYIFGITSTSGLAPGGASGYQKGLYVELSGPNTNTFAQSAAGFFVNNHTGTAAFNRAIYAETSGNSSIAGLFTSIDGIGISAGSVGGSAAVIANVSSGGGIGVNASAQSGTGVYSLSVSGVPLETSTLNSSLDSVITQVRHYRNLQFASIPANGVGLSEDFWITSTDGYSYLSNQIISKWTDVTSASRTSEFSIIGVNNAATQTQLTLRGSGQLQLNQYTTSTSFSGASGASVGVLNVDNTGKVFVGTGGGSSPLTTKGDLYTYDTADARLPVGTDGQMLYADSTTATGLKWDNAPTGGIKSGNATQVSPGVYETTITGVTSLTAGDTFIIKFDSVNQGASTLKINTLTAYDIFKNTNVKISSGDIKTDQEITIVYDGTAFQAIGLVTNQLLAYVHNSEAIAITKGQVVYAFGASGDKMSVKLAKADADATSAKTVGMVYDSSISAGGEGYIIIQGVIEGLSLGAFTAGDILYLSGATAGAYTATPTYAPTHRVYVGVVEKANPGNGQIYVRCQNGYELDELHDVQAQSPNDKDVLWYDSSVTPTPQWKTASIPTILGMTTVGNNLITLPNPSAVRYIKIKSDNTVEAISLATLKSDLGLLRGVQTSTLTNSSTAANTNITGCILALDANSTYIGRLVVSSGFVSTTGFNLLFTFPAGSTMNVGQISSAAVGGQFMQWQAVTSGAALTNRLNQANNQTGLATIEIFISTAGTSGNLTPAFVTSSNGSTATVYGNATFIQLEKI